MTLGEKIQELRVKNHLSQEQLGELLGTTRQSVSKWERDTALPEIGKIVRMAELFSVTTDYILREDVDTFVSPDVFRCRVLRGAGEEIVLTERFALCYYEKSAPHRIGCKLYTGSRTYKTCVAAVEYNSDTDSTGACGVYENGEAWSCGGDTALAGFIGMPFSDKQTAGLRITETFASSPAGREMPKVSEVGIASAMRLWRMGAIYENGGEMCLLHLCTAQTEYIFQIRPDYADIYIGASWNLPFELGLFAGEQYFRIRDCREREDYCSFHANFTSRKRDIKIPTEYAALGQCVSTPQGLMWCVKRYDDDEIVLEGCGGDEYIYSRKTDFTERYTTE